MYVAAGDIKGDGTAELVVTPDTGGGPRVTVYHTGSINPVATFFGIADPTFRGGARVAVGDRDHDGHADLAVAAGFGGGSRVSVYDGAALAQGRLVHPVGDFFAFSDTLRNGTYVSIGDVNGDGFADLVIGAGPGGGPRVLVLSGRTLMPLGAPAAVASPLANFYAGATSNRDGVTVAAKNLSGNGQADIVVGAGGGGSIVTADSGTSVAAGNPPAVDVFDSLPGYAGGVFVG
ncbi:MAG: repeat-containing protein [Gemmataceae bacterium]|nr:repeat-containing protein [Gemmataceae bacterium]